MSYNLTKLINFLNSNNLKKEANYLFKFLKKAKLKVDKNKILAMADIEYNLSFDIPSKRINPESQIMMEIIVDQIEKNYPKIVKNYLSFLMENNKQIDLAMNQFLKTYRDDQYDIVKEKYSNPEKMFQFIINLFKNYEFHIIFDSSETGYCTDALACNDQRGTIHMFLDKMFNIDTKLARWGEEGVLMVEPNERLAGDRVGTEQVYLGEGDVLQDIYEIDGDSIDLATLSEEESDKKREILENIKDEVNVSRTFVQEADQIGRYDFLIKVFDISFKIKEEQIHNAGDHFVIYKDDLPEDVKRYLNNKLTNVITKNIPNFFEKLNHILKHEVLHTKQIGQFYQVPDKKSDREEEIKETKYGDIGYTSYYGWPSLVFNILKRNNRIKAGSTGSRSSAKSATKAYVKQWLSPEHQNLFGVELKELLIEMFGSVTVTRQKVKIILDNYNQGSPTITYDDKTYDIEGTLFWYLNTLKLLKNIYDTEKSSGSRYSRSAYFLPSPFNKYDDYKHYTFEEIFRKMITHADAQVRAEPKSPGILDIEPSILDQADGFGQSGGFVGTARLNKIKSILRKYSNDKTDDKYYKEPDYRYLEYKQRETPISHLNELIDSEDIRYGSEGVMLQIDESKEGRKVDSKGNKIHGKKIDYRTILDQLEYAYEIDINNYEVTFSKNPAAFNNDVADFSDGKYLYYECGEYEEAYLGCTEFFLRLERMPSEVVGKFLRYLLKKKLRQAFQNQGVSIYVDWNGREASIGYQENKDERTPREESEIRTNLRKLVLSLNKNISFGGFVKYKLFKQKPGNSGYEQHLVK